MRWITGLFTVLSLCIQASVGDQFIRMPLTRRIITQAPPTYDGTLNSIVTSRPSFPGTLRTLHTNTSIPRSNDTIMSSLAESSRESMNNYFTLVYTARLQVGTPRQGTSPQEFDVVFDTGSSDLWVINTNNQKGRQSYMHYFNPSDSNTFQSYGTSFSIKYGTGYADGTNAREIVTLLGFKTQSVWFGVVNDFDDLFQNSMEPMDGILGLAFSSNHAPGTGPAASKQQADFPTVIDSLKLAGSIPRKMFSFVLDPNDGGDTSLFILGGIPDDISAKYAPKGFVQLPVPQAKYWYVPMQSISLGGDNAALCTVDSPCQSMLDTGTSLIVVPDSVFGQFVKKISSGRSDCYLTGSNSNQVWCTDFTYDHLPLMTVMFGGSMFVIYPSDYTIVNGNRLMLGISGIGSIAGGMFPACAADQKCFIFGDVFLKQHYTVYDMDYQNVSIAKDYDRPRPNRPEMRTVAKSNAWMYILIIVSVVCGVIGMLFLYRLWRKRQAYLQSESLLQNAVTGAVPQENRVPLSQRSGGYRLGSAPPAQPDRQRPLLTDATETGY